MDELATSLILFAQPHPLGEGGLVSIHDYAVQCYTMSGGTEVPVQTGHDLPHSTLYGVFAALDGYVVIAAQDTHVAGYAVEAAKPVVVAINKWDLVEGREAQAKTWANEIRTRLRFMKEVPVVFVSAKSGQRVPKILDEVQALYDSASKRVPTPELNRWLQDEAERECRAPAKGGSVRLFYAAQTGIRPPRFVLFCNEARRLHFSLRRHLENSLRERFAFGASPLRLTFRSRRERPAR